MNDQISFTDIATDPNTAITYRRRESLREEIFDQIRQQPLILDNLSSVPLKSRGAPGVGVFDYDGDNDLDIYVTNGPGASNSLYQNQLQETGQISFIDVATQAGVAAINQDSTGVSYGDIDNDGDLDLLVLGHSSPNLLFENQGNGTFIDITEQSNIGGENSYSTSSSIGDIDGDGLLDIVIANTFNWDNQLPIQLVPFGLNEPNQLLINRGNNVFEDVSDSSGLTNLSSLVPGPGVATITWAIAMVDYDLDGDLDIIHADDQGVYRPSNLGGVDVGYIQIFNNDGTGTFTNVTEATNLDQIGAWMGFSFGDFNADGNLDIFVTNFGDYTESLLLNGPVDLFDSKWFLGQDDGTFLDPGLGELIETPFGWGTSAFDYDNDADTDIVFHGGNNIGIFVDASNPGTILKNDGTANFSYDFDAIAGSTNHVRRNVQGVAVGDLNQDGFSDIVSVSNFDIPESVPLEPYPFLLDSELDDIARVLPYFIPTDNPDEFVWSGAEFTDGTLSIELNSGDNSNNWVAVETLGTVGLTENGQANRDGIGAVVFFTPSGGKTAINPILGGSSYASQDSLVANFGLGTAETGTVEVLWTGGVRNRLYDVQAGENLLFPEIPVSFDGEFEGPNDYQMQVDGAITELIEANVLSETEGDRFFASGVRAFMEENGFSVDLLFGSFNEDILMGNDSDEHLYGRGSNDFLLGENGIDSIFGGADNDSILGGRSNDQLWGEAGDDTIWGGKGDDLLNGGLGQDILNGGDGSDTFVLALGEGTDTIIDFALGEDLIGLAAGLSFQQLTLEGSEIIAGDEVLATLNLSVANLTEANFTLV
ncbi:FG-GAP-like repeat-containing protein [Dapis sp. BLCC M126]|uniref:FG-GAP-like repeat-containing protein n=1 Tax=Dapis sp. BLCC M126 TaxID=3400189 RepID=UPI003CEA9BB0